MISASDGTGAGTRGGAPRSASFFELGGDYIAPDVAIGQRSWTLRGQNVSVVVSWLAEGEELSEETTEDEHAILVFGTTALEVRAGGESQLASGPSLVIVPAGTASAVAKSPGWIVRVFTARVASVLARAINAEDYEQANADVAALPGSPDGGPGSLRVLSAAVDAASHPGDHSIFRTDSMLLHWFADWSGADEDDRLVPCSERDLERISITIEGDFVHHVRRPWGAALRTWRADEHVQCTSPSVSVIPPGNVNVTRAVGDATHMRVDVFAPARIEPSGEGAVVNAADYAPAVSGSVS